MSTNPFGVRRILAAVGCAAVLGSAAVSICAAPTPATGDVMAHAKFQVVTVIARPAPTTAATVTEADKPHQLQTTRAVPQILAPRTIVRSQG